VLPLRPLVLGLSLLVLCGSGAASAPAAPPAAGPSDPFGYYFLDTAKPLPAWAKKIDHLHLSTIDMKGDQMVTVPLWGFIRPKAGNDYRLVSPKIDGAHLTFTTKEIKGVSFDFDGRFLASGSFPETPPEGVVLTGRLRQRQGGKVVGEMKAGFLYSPGG